jgi:hypothetical protein
MRLIAGTLAILSFAACSPASPPPAVAGPDLASATAFADSFLASLAHPATSGTPAWFDTTRFVWARSGALLHADSLTALLKAQGAAGKAIVLGTSDVQLTPLGPDAVVWSGIVSGVVKDSAGAERAVRGALTLVLRRHGAGEWAIAAGHESVRPFDDTHEAAAVAPR